MCQANVLNGFMADSQRFCGWLLVSGFAVFMVGALLWKLDFQDPVLVSTLRSVGNAPGRWLWIHSWIAAGVVLSVAGLAAWTELQRRVGAPVLASVGTTIFLIGAVLWLIAIALRVSIQVWAASEVVAGRELPPVYPAIHRLMGLLYAAHMLLSYVSVVVLGWNVLNSNVLSARAGWSGIIGGGAAAIGFVALRGGPFAPPFLAHIYTCALGVLLIRRG